MVNFEDLVDQVLAIDDSKSRSDVILDLQYTKSVEQTINRIFDGKFLQIVKTKSASQALKSSSHTSSPTSNHNKGSNDNAIIILVSDDEEEEKVKRDTKTSELDIAEFPYDSELSPPSLPPVKRSIDFNDNDDEENDSQFSQKKYKDSLDSGALAAAVDHITKTYTLDDSLFDDDEDDLPPTTKKPKTPIEKSTTTATAAKPAMKAKKHVFEGIFPSFDSLERPDEEEDLPTITTEKPDKVIERSITLDSLEETTPASASATKEKKDIFDGIFPSFDSFDKSDQEDDRRKNEKFSSDVNESMHSMKLHKRKSPSFSPPFESRADDNDPFSIDSDPIQKTHSKAQSKSNSVSITNDSDSDDPLPSMDEFLSQMIAERPKKAAAKRKVIEIDEDDSTRIVDRKGKRRADDYNMSTPPSRRSVSLFDDDDNSISNSYTTITAAERKKLDAEERKRIQAEQRKKSAEEKQRLKEQKALEKQRLKEQKQLERDHAQLLEKENRLKNDRIGILKEMIIEFHPDFIKTKAGEWIQLILEKKEAVTKIMTNSLLPFHVTWRRICSSEWDPTTMTFIPFTPSKIVKEPYVLVFEDVYDFVVRVQQDTVDSFIDNIERQAGPGIQIMVLIEGLEVYYKKKLLATRRAVDNQVRSNIEGEGASSTTNGRQRKTNVQTEIIKNGPEREQVEESINYLQLMRDIMFVPTKSDEDTASWLESLTTDLALGRYKTKNANNSLKASKSGTDPKDSYHKMLQEIQLCTPAIASSVIGEYPTLQSLHKAYECISAADGERLLGDLEVERSAMTARDRRVNRVMSKKIYTIFNSNDPDQTIY